MQSPTMEMVKYSGAGVGVGEGVGVGRAVGVGAGVSAGVGEAESVSPLSGQKRTVITPASRSAAKISGSITIFLFFFM